MIEITQPGLTLTPAMIRSAASSSVISPSRRP